MQKHLTKSRILSFHCSSNTLLIFIVMTMLQQRNFETQICFMTILISKLLLNSVLQLERLFGLAVMTRDL